MKNIITAILFAAACAFVSACASAPDVSLCTACPQKDCAQNCPCPAKADCATACPAQKCPTECPTNAADCAKAKCPKAASCNACPAAAKCPVKAECPLNKQKCNAAAKKCPVASPKTCKLADTTWAPVFLKDQGDAKMPDAENGGTVFLHFGADMKINGMSGNNLFMGGNAKIAPCGLFSAGAMASTRKMGPYAEYENKFLSALDGANKICVDGDKLTLFKDDVKLIEFKKIPNIEK